MNPIKKMSLLDAITRFRNEIKDLKISANKRVQLLESFKQAFSRSLDYDLAFDRVAGEIAPEFARSITVMPFKSFWKAINEPPKEDFAKLFGITNAVQDYRNFIDSEFKSGKREVDIINELLLDAQNKLNRPLDQSEIDKFRYVVIDEKVKLRRNGIKIAD